MPTSTARWVQAELMVPVPPIKSTFTLLSYSVLYGVIILGWSHKSCTESDANKCWADVLLILSHSSRRCNGLLKKLTRKGGRSAKKEKVDRGRALKSK